uniref:Uncharacterized protein n=2 Tax=Anguilla anguilla TaxID=7936 RepID=A0A0E9TGB6_ANGAN
MISLMYRDVTFFICFYILKQGYNSTSFGGGSRFSCQTLLTGYWITFNFYGSLLSRYKVKALSNYCCFSMHFY